MAAQTTAHASFELVLRKLSSDGRDALIKDLKRTFSLNAARLACRALRDVVDGSLISQTMDMTPALRQSAAAGERSPLWRLPRLLELTIVAKTDRNDIAGVDTSTLLSIPLVGQPSACLQRIERLYLYNGNGIPLPGVALASILYQLPNLRLVSFRMYISFNPAHQMILFHALASLQRLEELQLPSLFLLQYAGPLASRLVTLELSDVQRPQMNHEALAQPWLLPALARMCGLRTLNLHFSREHGDDSRLAELLNHLPPALEELNLDLQVLEEEPFGEPGRVILMLESRRIVSISIGADLPLERYARLVCNVLLPSRRLAPQPRFLQLKGIHVIREGLGDGEQLQQLRALAQRCQKVEVTRVSLFGKVRPEVAVRTVEALGGPPEMMRFMGFESSFRLMVKPDEAQRAACAAEDWTAAAGGASQRPVAEVFLAERVLKRLTAAAAAAAVADAAAGAPPAAPAPGGAGDGDGLLGSEQGGGLFHLVLLRSPSLRVLAWSADALLAWMRQLAAQVPEGGAGGDAQGRVQWYLPVPSAATVLVECRSAEDAAAVAAAARKVLGIDDACGGAAAVEVRSLAPEPLSGWNRKAWLTQEMFKVAQEFWDNGAGGSEAERLRVFVEMGNLAACGPPAVDLYMDSSEEGEGEGFDQE